MRIGDEPWHLLSEGVKVLVHGGLLFHGHSTAEERRKIGRSETAIP
jgi:hypothetical protein